ncbi:hypothetical protein [Paenibacillus sp. EPM92]|uniref:hypothetical protein n=1 Tax=Paenibacillus sp. EPM92 TaxID=1561195 RepID=UPI001914E4FC|nr:hypothetical protein [Paenibacillus sp. EPM92]
MEKYIRTLMQAFDIARRAYNEIDRLKKQLEDEQREKTLLLQQIERAIEDQRKELPVIPLEVAEAIIWFRKYDYTTGSFAKLCWTEHMYDDNHHTRTLKQYVKNGFGDTLLQALVNGYTVEQALEPTFDDKFA